MQFTRDSARQILDTYPELHRGGYSYDPGNFHAKKDRLQWREELYTDKSLDVIIAVAKWCADLLPPNWDYGNSYSFKHAAERELGKSVNRYVANGECIAGMLLAGYRLRKPVSYNPRFSMPPWLRRAKHARRPALSDDYDTYLKLYAE